MREDVLFTSVAGLAVEVAEAEHCRAGGPCGVVEIILHPRRGSSSGVAKFPRRAAVTSGVVVTFCTSLRLVPLTASAGASVPMSSVNCVAVVEPLGTSTVRMAVASPLLSGAGVHPQPVPAGRP